MTLRDFDVLVREPGGPACVAIGNMRAAATARRLGFDLVALCAEELQVSDPIEARMFEGMNLVSCPLPDDNTLRREHLELAARAAGRVTRAYATGHRCLVTCAMGINRSAFLCGLALHLSYGLAGADAVRLIRATRSDKCLSNRAFESFLQAIPERPGHPFLTPGDTPIDAVAAASRRARRPDANLVR